MAPNNPLANAVEERITYSKSTESLELIPDSNPVNIIKFLKISNRTINNETSVAGVELEKAHEELFEIISILYLPRPTLQRLTEIKQALDKGYIKTTLERTGLEPHWKASGIHLIALTIDQCLSYFLLHTFLIVIGIYNINLRRLKSYCINFIHIFIGN